MTNVFFDIGIIVIVSTVFAYAARLLKQPLIPAYVIAGIVLGPYLGFITNTEVINNLSEIGIAFLLFIVGLEIDVRKLKDVGLVASLGGVLQIAAVFALAFAASVLMGFFALESAYLGLIIAFSSTMVVVKLLSDKKELDTLHGRIVIGILLLQDIFAIFALSILSQGAFSYYSFALSLFKGIAVILASLFAGKYIFPPLFRFAASSQELLFIASVGVAFLFSIVVNSIGFSIAVGAFIAGIALNVPYNIEIIGKIKPLRDFFSVLFFVSLGMQLSLPALGSILKPLLVLAALHNKLIAPLTSFASLHTHGFFTPFSFGTAFQTNRITSFTTTMWMINRIHNFTTDNRTPTLETHSSRFTQAYQFVIGISHLTHCRQTFFEN